MSHFTVLVVGEDPEAQLEPFNETFSEHLKWESRQFTAAKHANPELEIQDWALTRLVRIDKLPEMRKEFQEDLASGKTAANTIEEYVYEYYYGEISFVPGGYLKRKPEIRAYQENVYLSPNERKAGIEPPPADWHICFEGPQENYPRYGIMGEDGRLTEVVCYEVRCPRWDWYVLGGRWENYFKVKPEVDRTLLMYGSTLLQDQRADNIDKVKRWPSLYNQHEPVRDGCDSLVKGLIDFDATYQQGYKLGADNWEKYHGIVAGRYHKTFTDFIKEAGGDIIKARELQEADPVDQALRKTDFLWFDVDELEMIRDMSKDQYADIMGWRDMTPYAVVKDGQWLSRGEMGWFGVSHGKVKIQDWVNQVRDIYQNAADSDLFSLYDCHI